jgi:hypothetical protein
MKYIVYFDGDIFGVPFISYLKKVVSYKKNRYSAGINLELAHKYTTEKNAQKAAMAFNGKVKTI